MLFIIWGVMAIAAAVSVAASATSCSLSYQNISSHGTTDRVGETAQETSPEVTTTATANVSGIPARLTPSSLRLTGPAGPVGHD